MPTATIDDVARLAGVSIKTVSRVVNGEPNVRESTREKVNAAIGTLNYRPNLSARNLASKSSHLIALIYDDPSAYDIPSSGYVIRMQQGALSACRTVDFQLLIHPCRFSDDDIDKKLETLITGARPDGIVLAAPLSNIPKVVDTVAATKTPFVRLSPGEPNGGVFAVATNDREISAEMTRYLASLGHRKIAFLTGHTSHRAVHNRFLGYKDGLEQSGIAFSERLVAAGDNSIGSGEAAAMQLLQQDDRPTAIFAANDDMAAGVMRAASKLGIDVPGGLSVAGCDDVTLAQQIYPSLTTIRQPLSRMAETAAMTLIRQAHGVEAPTGTEIVPGALRIRKSTGPAPDAA